MFLTSFYFSSPFLYSWCWIENVEHYIKFWSIINCIFNLNIYKFFFFLLNWLHGLHFFFIVVNPKRNILLVFYLFLNPRNFQIISYSDVSLKFRFYCWKRMFEYVLLNYSNNYITEDSSPSFFKILYFRNFLKVIFYEIISS